LKIRIPRNAQRKPLGTAVIEFATEKDVEQAMGRNKNYISGKKIILKKSAAERIEVKPKVPVWEVKASQANNQVETIEESGRLFVRNLWFGVTEEELEKLFGKFGPLSEVNVPVDTITKKMKGFAHIEFVFPEHALKAYTELDYTSLHGRLMHILPGYEKSSNTTSDEKSSFKKKKDLERKANSSNSYNWNSLFLGINAVADAMAKKYKTEKSNILDSDAKGSIGVRMALGETQIVAETRDFLLSNGVALDAFSQAAGERSKTSILVKNLPAGVTTDELRDIFLKYGSVARVVMPPSGITAIVEYLEPSEARKGFLKLNFSKFRSIPLYLEWAPMGVFNTPPPKQPIKSDEGDENETSNAAEKETPAENGSDISAEKTEKANESSAKDDKIIDTDDIEPEEGSSVFVKNLNFTTTDEELYQHFTDIGTIHSATVAKKKDYSKPGELLSMGYGFVQFLTKSDAKEALKSLQNSELDGHKLELKLSTRTVTQTKGKNKQNVSKQTSSKILVRNIPFEANIKEIQELFKVFGELKFVRLPKKLHGTGPHRGFAFVDFQTKSDAKRAFNALCHSTHLYGRRLVLEWAQAEESVDELRRKTAQHFSDDGPRKKISKTSIMKELE